VERKMQKLKEKFVDICQKLHNKGLSPGFSGNISLKVDNKILVTPSGSSLGDIDTEKLVVIDFEGNIIEGTFKPTSEKFLHIEIYKKRPDINAIIHCHAPKISAFAVAGIPLNEPILAENVLLFGEIPIAKYALPSSDELAEIVSSYFTEHDAVLMANHGVITGGKDLKDVFYKMETIEYCAEVYLYAKLLGNINQLTKEEVKQVIGLRKKRD
jgi:L-fuculose-phosphate aldolase